MIEGIVEEPLALTRHRTAPLLVEREQFLSHLLRQGTSHGRVRSIAAYLLHIVRLMELTSLRTVSLEEIKKAGECWANYRGPYRKRKTGKAAAFCFTNVAKKWFRFHDRLAVAPAPVHPFNKLTRKSQSSPSTSVQRTACRHSQSWISSASSWSLRGRRWVEERIRIGTVDS